MKPEILTRSSADKLALIERLKIGKPGDTVTYEELAAVIGRSVKSSTPGYAPLSRARWNCIREHQVVWEPLADHTGLKCINDAELLAQGSHALTHIRRKARRANVKLSAAKPDKLTNDERVTLAGLLTLNAAIMSAASEKSLKRIEGSIDSAHKPLPVGRTLEILKS